MKIVVDAHWDDEAKVWIAVARDAIGLVTEAPNVEALEKRIALVLPDLLDGADSGTHEFELVTRRTHPLAAE